MTNLQVERCRNKTVEMVYFSTQGIFSHRRIKVLGITDKQLYGYCYLRKQPRTFYLDGILALTPISND